MQHRVRDLLMRQRTQLINALRAHMAELDAIYIQRNLDAELTDGVTNDPATALATLLAIKAFALAERTIVLPAHDPDGAARLAARAIYFPGVNNCAHALKSTL